MLQRHGFARTGRPHERKHLALVDSKGHAGKDFPAVEPLHDVLKPNHGADIIP